MGITKKIWFGAVLPLFVLLILGFSFYRFYIQKDFVSYDFIPCDSTTNTCFVEECSEDDPRCSPFMTEDGMYFFSVLETRTTDSVVYYCSETRLEEFGNFVFDATCSE